MFSGKAEMGRDFYVKIVNADKEVTKEMMQDFLKKDPLLVQVRQAREMLVMARCQGLANLQQVTNMVTMVALVTMVTLLALVALMGLVARLIDHFSFT